MANLPTIPKAPEMGYSSNLANQASEYRVATLSKQDVYNKSIDESQTLFEKTNNRLKQIPVQLRLAVVPVGLYAFSKYKGYDGKKTAKVTIIGSVGIFALLFIDAMSGWSSPSNRHSQKILRSLGLISNPTLSIKNLSQQQQNLLKQLEGH